MPRILGLNWITWVKLDNWLGDYLTKTISFKILKSFYVSLFIKLLNQECPAIFSSPMGCRNPGMDDMEMAGNQRFSRNLVLWCAIAILCTEGNHGRKHGYFKALPTGNKQPQLTEAYCCTLE